MNATLNSLTHAASLRRNVEHPTAYIWLVLLSTLDIIFTCTILQLGGTEVNLVAQQAINLAGHWGLIALKFPCLIVALLICEYVSARRPMVARRLAGAAIALSAFPVVVAITELTLHSIG